MSCINAQEQRLLRLINDYRVVNGVPALRPSAILMQAAHDHASDMAAHDYMSHTGRNGSTHSSRARALGYPTDVAGNILWGQPDADAAFVAWRDSPPHRANMLTAHYTEIGVAVGIDPAWNYPGDHFQTASTEFGMGRTALAIPCRDGARPTEPVPPAPPKAPTKPPIVHLSPERAERRAERHQTRWLDRLLRRLGIRP